MCEGGAARFRPSTVSLYSVCRDDVDKSFVRGLDDAFIPAPAFFLLFVPFLLCTIFRTGLFTEHQPCLCSLPLMHFPSTGLRFCFNSPLSLQITSFRLRI
eukprot:RCo045412